MNSKFDSTGKFIDLQAAYDCISEWEVHNDHVCSVALNVSYFLRLAVVIEVVGMYEGKALFNKYIQYFNEEDSKYFLVIHLREHPTIIQE